MRGMNDVKEFPLIPDGKHKFLCTAAESKTSAKGNTMIEVVWEARGTPNGEFDGLTMRDWIITDGAARGAIFGKRKLEKLGIDTSVDCEDSEIAEQILGIEVEAVVGHEPRLDKEKKPMFEVNADGRQVPVYTNRLIDYVPAVLSQREPQPLGAVASQNQQQAAQMQFTPQQIAAMQAQMAAQTAPQTVPGSVPPGFQMPPGFAPPNNGQMQPPQTSVAPPPPPAAPAKRGKVTISK